VVQNDIYTGNGPQIKFCSLMKILRAPNEIIYPYCTFESINIYLFVLNLVKLPCFILPFQENPSLALRVTRKEQVLLLIPNTVILNNGLQKQITAESMQQANALL